MASNPAPTGATTPNMQKSPPTALKSVAKYDYTAIEADWNDAMQIRRQFDQDVLLLGDQLYRQRDPATPYLKVVGDDGTTNLAVQITDPTLTALVDKAVDNDVSGPVQWRAQIPANTGRRDNLALCEATLDFVFGINRGAARDIQRQIAWNFNLFGWNALEVAWLDPDDAAEYLHGFPVMLTLHNPMSVAYEHDGAGYLKRVIVAKRMLYGELPAAWQNDANKKPGDQVQVYEHFDRENFAAVLEGDVVAQYPHGCVDLWGSPCVPFSIKLHDEMKIRLGDAPPTLSASSPREAWVGRPPWMGLYKPITEMSYYRTALRFNVKENIFPWAISEGQTEPDYASHTIQIPALGAGKWSWAEVPNLLADINQAIVATDQQIQAGGMSSQLATGQVPTQTSGAAMNAGTTFVKQRFEALRTSRCDLLRDAGLLILAQIKAHTAPSTAQTYQKKTGQPLKAYGGATDVSKLHTDGTPLPMSAAISAAVLRGIDPTAPQADQLYPINSETLSGIVDLDVTVESMEQLPKEQRMQLGMSIWNQKVQKLPDEYIYGELWGLDDPAEVKRRLDYQLLRADPSLPLMQLDGLRAWARELESSPFLPPQALAGLQQQLQQADQFELSVLQGHLQQLFQGASAPPTGGPPGGTLPPPPGAPPPAPPQGGPMPMPMPQQMPQQMPPPMPIPQPGVSTPGGTPAPVMAPPGMPQGGPPMPMPMPLGAPPGPGGPPGGLPGLGPMPSQPVGLPMMGA